MKGKKLGQLIVMGILAAAASACAKKDVVSERQRTQAPTGPQDVGLVLENVERHDLADFLEQHPEAQVRVLSEEHGLYEVFGADRAELESALARTAEPNQFFRLPNPSRNLASIPAPAGLKVADLPPCKANPQLPTAVLKATQPVAELNGATIELGRTVKLDASQSRAASAAPGALRTVIAVSGPAASMQPEVISKATQYEFTPDALGVYQAVVLVQDSRDVCALDGITFIVSANRKFEGRAKDDLKLDLNRIGHLQLVSAQQSWELSEGQGLLIAIIDSGVNYNHPSLSPNIELNEKEIDGNGRDDDGNGYVDDVLGYDFVNSDAFPYDDEGHGTHVVGLAASRQFGLARKARILPIKALTGIGGDIASIAASIRYAVDRGAKIINLSLGAPAPLPHPALASAAKYAESKGVILVAAAGNGDQMTGLGFDIDNNPVFPASLPNPNVIAVGSFDKDNVLSTYSNFGKRSVHVIAPGGAMPKDPMYSTAFENPRKAMYVGMSGTSMAAPVVSGIIAQLWSFQPHLNVADIKNILLKAGKEQSQLKDISGSGRHLDALAVLDAAEARNVLY